MSATIFISAPSGLSISLSHFLFFSTSTTSLNRFYQDYFYLFGTDLVIDLDLEERVVDLDLEERVVMRSRRRKTPPDHFSSIADPILPSIKTTIDLCRRASVPVSFTRHSHKSPSDYDMLGEWWSNDLIIDGTPEANLMPEIGRRPGEEVVEKNTYSLELWKLIVTKIKYKIDPCPNCVQGITDAGPKDQKQEPKIFLSLYLLCAPLCHNSFSLYIYICIQNSENTDGMMMRGIWFDGFIWVLVSFLLMRMILNFIFKQTTKGIKVDLVWSSPAIAVWWFCTELVFAGSCCLFCLIVF